LKGSAILHIYGSKAAITISSQVWRDSQFPFNDNEKLDVEINNNDLVISKSGKRQDQKRLMDEA